MSALAPALQAYFTDRLVAQRGASPNTIAAYCLTFRLLLRFGAERTGKPPSALDISQLDAPLIAAFLNHLEKHRGNSVATRNNRLAAIHSLFAYLALNHPEHAASPGTSPSPPPVVPRSRPSTSRCTRSDTPPRCASCWPATTSP